eukprot:5744609-Pleurochrysis_carterae.AAC.3
MASVVQIVGKRCANRWQSLCKSLAIAVQIDGNRCANRWQALCKSLAIVVQITADLDADPVDSRAVSMREQQKAAGARVLMARASVRAFAASSLREKTLASCCASEEVRAASADVRSSSACISPNFWCSRFERSRSRRYAFFT